MTAAASEAPARPDEDERWYAREPAAVADGLGVDPTRG